MSSQEMIAADTLCECYHIPLTFLQSLQEFGLLQSNIIEEQLFIQAGELQQLEKIIHLHYELDINMEGIEAIFHLLNRMQNLQQELLSLRNRQ